MRGPAQGRRVRGEGTRSRSGHRLVQQHQVRRAGYNEPNPTLGYEGISTASAGNAKSGQVAIHETGHSLGKLADEYFYPGTPGYEKYTGPETAEPNTSTLTPTACATPGPSGTAGSANSPRTAARWARTKAAGTTSPASTGPPTTRSCGCSASRSASPASRR
ncbi:M64 family metallopeptidase [Streptomyces cirratus]